jgi:predicted phage tail protein
MALIAAPFVLSSIGSALPMIGGFVTDVLAFTGASAIINDVVQSVDTKIEQPKTKKQEIDITPEPNDVKELLERRKAFIGSLKGRL